MSSVVISLLEWCFSWRGVLSLMILIITWSLYWNTRRKIILISKIPSFISLPIIGNVLHINREPSGFYKQITELCDQFRHEQVYKLKFGVNHTVVIFTAEQVEKLVTSYGHIDKSYDYDFLHRWLGFGLLTSTGSLWKSRRRLLTPSFHFNILQDALVTMNVHAANLGDKLLQEVGNNPANEPIDIFRYLTLTSLDIIGETSLGTQMDALHHEESEYVKAVYLVKHAISTRQRTPWMWPNFMFNNLPIGRAANKAIDLMLDHSLKVIQERRAARVGDTFTDGPKVFLDTLLDYQSLNPGSLTDDDIREEVETFMFEGHDTVSSALGFTVYLIGSHPEIQMKCQQEVDEVVGSPRNVAMDDLSRLTYLEWCIREAMRIFPPVPFFGRNLSADIEIAGYTVPKDAGSIVVITSGLHRDPKYFPDPEKFDPTRFSPDNCAKRNPYAYIPFSAGPRNCIGQRFAMMELKVIMCMLLLNFNIRSTQKRSELKLNPGLVLQPSAGIWVVLEARAADQ